MKKSLQHCKETSPVKLTINPDKPFVGKFICYGEEDGSFSFGKIVDEGIVNTPKGEREVFILENRTTCRVPKGDLEMQSVQAISRKIGPGGQRQFLASPSKEEQALLAEKTEGPKEQEPQPYRPPERPPEIDGLVPDLGKLMSLNRDEMGSRTPMKEMVRTIKSSEDPNKTITFLVRRYEYRTNVRKERLNVSPMQDGGDIVDRDSLGMGSMTDDELFLCVMSKRTNGLPINQGMKNMLEASSVMADKTTTVEELPNAAVNMVSKILKKRLKDDEVVEPEVVSPEPKGIPGLPDLAKLARPFGGRK